MKFDAITTVPSGAQAQATQKRLAERLERQQKANAMRQMHLLDQAWRLWIEVGQDGFNMRQLAQRAGYTAGALYAYFPSRDAILFALRQKLLLEMSQAVNAVQEKTAAAFRHRKALSPDPNGTARTAGRALFVSRSLAWWRPLCTQGWRLSLLLAAKAEPVAPASDPGVLASSLAEATQSCTQALLPLGLAPDAARRLQSDALALGLGLALMSVSPAARLAGPTEGQFVDALERWLDGALGGGAAPPAASDADDAGTGQGDLFDA